MKAIVHIGAPKTGSSTIQQFLRLNAVALSRQGIHYERFFPEEKSQFEFPMAALARMGKTLPNRDEQLRYGAPDLETQRIRSEAVMKRLADEAASWPEPTAIFSSEHIRPWLSSVEAVRVFDEMFRGIFDEVRYVLYVRNQEDLILSLYSQDVKNGGSTRLGAYFHHILKFMDLEAGVMRWIQAVGRERFDLRLFDPGFLPNGDLLQDFALACGIAIDALKMPPATNESLSAPAAEVLRQLNARIPRLLPQGGYNPLSAGLVEQVIAAAGPGPRLALNTEQRSQLDEKVAASNERIRVRFFPDREVLFTPARENDAFNERRVLREAVEIAAELIVRSRLGDWPDLSQEERARARRRKPAENAPTVAAPSQPSDHRSTDRIALGETP